MEDICVVERLQALNHLDEDTPDILFPQVCLLLLMARDLLEQVSIVGILHDDTIE